MEKIRKILLYAATDTPAKVALKKALALATQWKAGVTVVDVVPRIPDELHLEGGFTTHTLQRWIIEYRRRQLQRLIAVQPGEQRLSTKILVGTPFLEIIREVMRGRHGLVIKALGPQGGDEHGLFGPDDMHLLRKCPCPVWLVKPSRQTRIRCVLAAIDVPQEGGGGLNERILDLAAGVAVGNGAALHVVHAVGYYADYLPIGRGLSLTQLEVLKLRLRSQHQHWIKTALTPYAAAQPRIHVTEGSPEEAISNLAARLKADLVVMGTVGRAGIPGLLMGNTAEKVFRRVDASVLAVKPEGFETPVRIS